MNVDKKSRGDKRVPSKAFQVYQAMLDSGFCPAAASNFAISQQNNPDSHSRQVYLMINASPYLAGLVTGASLIIAIGAQNAFVLTQAVRHNHALAVATLCATLDALLIAAGVCGVGTLIAESRVLSGIASLGGAAFLFWFGARSLMEAFKSNSLDAETASPGGRSGLLPTLAATLAVSLLNPHVYLDTVIMLGAVSANFPGQGRYLFGAGAASASLVWFFSLSLAGTMLAPLFKKPGAWRVLHLAVTLMVWWVAVTLLVAFFKAQA